MYWKIHSQNETQLQFLNFIIHPSLGQSADPFLNARKEAHGPGELAGGLGPTGRMQCMSLFWYRRGWKVRMGWMKSKHSTLWLVEIWNCVGISLQRKTICPTYIILMLHKLHTHCFKKKSRGIHNPSSRGSDIIFWSPKALHAWGAHICI